MTYIMQRWRIILAVLLGASVGAWNAALTSHVRSLEHQLATAPVVSVHTANGPPKLGSISPPAFAGDFVVSPAAASPFAIKDGSSVTRDSFETTHGRIKAGGGGSDFHTDIGPLVGNETTASALYLLGNATSPSVANYAAYSDGASLYINAPTGDIGFLLGGGYVGYFRGALSRFYIGGLTGPIIFDWSTATTPYLQTGTTATSFTLGPNKAGAVTNINVDSNVSLLQMAGGTQDGLALGANLSTVGHWRTPAGFSWGIRNNANTGNLFPFESAAGGDIAYFAQNYSATNIYGSSSITIGANTSTLTLGTTTTNTITNGSVQSTTRTITGNLTVDTTTTDYTIYADTSGGVISVTLPTPTNGRVLLLVDKKSTFGTNNLTLVRHGSEKINNVAASKVLSASGGRWQITSDGTDWYLAVGGLPQDSAWLIALGIALLVARRRAANDDEQIDEAA